MKYFVLVFSLSFWLAIACSQTNQKAGGSREKSYRILFYNVENLFNIEDDTLVNDSEFTPGGKKNWTYDRYSRKLDHIYQVISAAGAPRTPEIIGMCEVENRNVLEDLLRKTPLKKAGYAIIHKDSPDERGIDVALLYNRKHFKPLKYDVFPVNLPGERSRPTRDILYVKGVLGGLDTLHIFVNHWPSRSGGQKDSEPKRVVAAQTLRTVIDSLFNVHVDPGILIMGDLNDDPGDKSLTEGLQTRTPSEPYASEELFNLSAFIFQDKANGSLKYRGAWNLFDQMIVSGALLAGKKSFSTHPASARILRESFLLKPDEKFMGDEPFRTYNGDRYAGGYSDHLPVYLDLKRK